MLQVIKLSRSAIMLTSVLWSAHAQAETTLTIATVNNPDMLVMEKLSSHFEAEHPDVKLCWVTLEENVLRQRVTVDISTHSGQFDVMTVGIYEVPIWAKLKWLSPFDSIPETYEVSDLLPSVRNGLTIDGKLYALPFYAESTFTVYRKDLFAKAGLTMPEHPTWMQIADFAKKINDPANGIYGICLRGKPGWGENMAVLGDMANSFGGRFFDMGWQPQFTSDPWEKAVAFYVRLLKDAGPPGVTSDGYNEMLALFAGGHCGMWVDSTVSAGFLTDPKQSKVSDEIGYAQAPYEVTPIGSHYLWAWTLAVPATSHQTELAKQFVQWATSPAYLDLVAQTQGWGLMPPGTRTSTYENPQYLNAAPFAPAVLEAIRTADPNHPTQLPVPYTGIGYASIPEWQAIGTVAGQYIAGAVSGQDSAAAALEQAQQATRRTMVQAGYLK